MISTLGKDKERYEKLFQKTTFMIRTGGGGGGSYWNMKNKNWNMASVSGATRGSSGRSGLINSGGWTSSVGGSLGQV